MKKIYSLLTLFFALSVGANAVTHNVSIGGTAFTPSFLTGVVVGDIVKWTLVSGTHNTRSDISGASVPATALTWNSNNMTTTSNTTFSYTVTVAGSYIYGCSIHGGPGNMGGGWNAAPVGINEPLSNLITSVYPNPFNDKVTIKYDGIESIEMFNVVGEQVKSLNLSSSQNKAEIDFAGLPAGIYFYRTYKEGVIVETRKIIKAN
ncbi:MAG: T9SS type A sorting domain-containing protein [Bacteroidota bacterium]